MISFLSRHPALRTFFLCSLSAVLLVLSFPHVDCGALIWGALVPWLFAVDGPKKRRAFGWSYLLGVFFFAGALYWFMFVTVPGGILLFFYLGLYFALFGLACAYFFQRPLWIKCVALPSAWVTLEFVRGHLLSGFGWVDLAHSQHKNWLLIQIADVTGVYGISFLVVLVNILVKENLAFVLAGLEVPPRRELVRLNVVVLCVLLGAFGYGFWRVTHAPRMDVVKVGLVQGNIPQDEKWILTEREAIIDKYLLLSKEAVKDKPDILIWPETAFPGFEQETPYLMDRIREFVRESGIPLLLGIVTTTDTEYYYNSAVLLSPAGDTVDQYDKLHLVPFGEYLPLRKQLPQPVIDLVGIEDFSPGKKPTVFHPSVRYKDGMREVPLSVAICFEDTLAHITRRFVQNGAQLLVNMTNDAWFKDSKEPFMHLQASLFRSVETKRSLVRAANTGITCGIDPYGRPLKYGQDHKRKKTYVDAVAVFWVPLNREVTFYTKMGDIFTYFCFLCILWAGYIRRK
jgi:apolipoprotein N-acyltransferase